MKRNNTLDSGNRSLRTFLLFCLVVVLLITGSLSVRLFFLFRDSSFDGKHRFTLEVRHTPREFDILTFEPVTRSLNIYNLTTDKDTPSITNTYGVPVDGTISDQGGSVSNKNVLNKLYRYMLRITSGENVNSLDIARLIFFAYGVERSDIVNEKISSKSFIGNDALDEVFLDHALIDENKTIAIVNAAGEPGLAGKTERILNRLGANVVSVTTAPSIEKKSRIEYMGESSYTLERVVDFAEFPSQSAEEEGISDILIVLGEDSIELEEE